MNRTYTEIAVDQGSPEWHRARCGCLTASRAGVLMDGSARAKNNLLDDLEAEELGGPRPEQKSFIPALEWGKKHEERARALYNLNFPRMDSCGFFLSSLFGWVGGSPDGVCRVADDRGIVGGLEIKCPYNPAVHESHRMGTIAPAYFWQIQFNMWLLQTEYWDFMSFDPRRTGDGQVHFRRFERDASIMKRIESEVHDWNRHRSAGTRYKDAATPLELMAAGVLPKFF